MHWKAVGLARASLASRGSPPLRLLRAVVQALGRGCCDSQNPGADQTSVRKDSALGAGPWVRAMAASLTPVPLW